MYKHNLKQLEFTQFSLPFQGQLSRDNKWVKLAVLIPWEQFEERYQKNFSNRGVGHPALSVRMALAALIIKEELGASDRACVEQITENPNAPESNFCQWPKPSASILKRCDGVVANS